MGRAVVKLQEQTPWEFLLLRGSVDIILDKKYVGPYAELRTRWNCPLASQNNGEGTHPGEREC